MLWGYKIDYEAWKSENEKSFFNSKTAEEEEKKKKNKKKRIVETNWTRREQCVLLGVLSVCESVFAWMEKRFEMTKIG